MGLTKKIFIVSIVLLALSLAGYVFLYIDHEEVKGETLILAAEASKTETKSQSLQEVDLFLRGTDTLAVIDSYFVSKEGVVDFISELETLGVETRVAVEIESVSIEPRDHELFEELEVDLAYAGSWSDVILYTKKLESMPYKLLVKRLTLESSTNENKETVWSGRALISVVKFKK